MRRHRSNEKPFARTQRGGSFDVLEPIVRSNLPRLQGLYDRCPSPGRHLLASARGLLLAQIRYSKKTMALLSELRVSESWSPSEIDRYQTSALRQIIDYAIRTVPFYSDYNLGLFHSPRDLRRFPVLDRETVLQNQECLLSRDIKRHRRIRAATTGTTGTSLHVAYTETVASKNWAFLLRQWAWAGVPPRHPRITLQGSRIVPAHRARLPYWTYNLAERQILMSIFHLSETSAPAYIAFLQKHPGYVLEGFPSTLAILADFVLASGMSIPMRALFTSGEPLHPTARANIQKAFAARVFDTYGMTEYCGLIQECERGQMHLVPEYGFLEILGDNHEPVAPGEEGYFVWTGFLNEAMPLVRYRIGDRGSWQTAGACACGRSFPLVVPSITRESDLLRCPDGRLLSARALNQLLKQSASLQFCQFVHDKANHLIVRAVVRPAEHSGRAAEELMDIRARVADLAGPCMQVTASLAAGPITRPGGKIPMIVNQVIP
jgi:phenylacetate-coenzyme A ligase PaaK-like adenylate-forming protein